ncbi:MAG: hypothetical protein HRU75_13450 [Planctomycetia bacterium]|nr:MAG: hypothetical protein HRU75_13450 [Planctomycetia bacterium]
MESLSTTEHVEHLTAEYRLLTAELGEAGDDAQLRALLVRGADWTEEGAAAVVHLAKQYGSFVLANALALAEALEIEDGEAGI